MVDLIETSIDHHGTQDLAANATGAVGDYWFVLQVVILATLKFSNKVVSGLHVWNDGVLELTNLCLKSISAIEEDHVVPAFLNKLVHLRGLEVLATVLNARFLDDNLIRGCEGNQLLADLDTELGEVVAGAVRPLKVGLSESGVFPSGLNVLLEIIHVATKGSVDSVLGDQDPSLEIQ